MPVKFKGTLSFKFIPIWFRFSKLRLLLDTKARVLLNTEVGYWRFSYSDELNIFWFV